MRPRILIVEDDSSLAQILRDNLLLDGFDVECASHADKRARAVSFVRPRSRAPGCDAARSERVRARARAEAWRKDADHHPVGARREGRQTHGASSRRRRLHHEAVRHGRAGGAHQYRVAKSEADSHDDPARRRHDRFSKRDRHRPSTAICTSVIASSRFCGCWPSATPASCFAMSSSGKSGAFSTPARPARSIARCRDCGRRSKRIQERPVFYARSTATATS